MTDLLRPEVKEISEEISVRGAIPEVDQGAMRFQLQLSDGSRVHAPVTTQHFATILEAFNGYKSGSRVVVQGIAKLDRRERLQSFESVEHVSMLDPLDVVSRLEDIGHLEDGWLDGKGIAPKRAGLEWLARQFDQHFPDDLPLPHVFPTAEGGVLAEWSLGDWEPSLEIDLTSHSAAWHSLNLQTGEETVRELALDQSADWRWIGETLADLAGAKV
jgi:hypothetical protein